MSAAGAAGTAGTAGTAAGHRPRRRAATRSRPASVTTAVWADVSVLTALSLIAIAGFEPAFGPYNYLLAALGGLAVGTGVAIVCFVYRLRVLGSILIAVAAYLVVGSAVAMPGQALAGVLPTPTTLAGLVLGPVFGFPDIVTLRAPVEAPPYIAVVPYVAAWLVSFVCVSLACRWLPGRPRTVLRASVLLIGPTAIYLTGVLIGTSQPYYAGVRGVAFAAIALVWLGWRRRGAAAIAITVDPAVRRRTIRGVAVLVAAAVVLGGAAGALLAPVSSSRFVLRDQITPPFDAQQYPSPLAGFRHFTKAEAKTRLFTVSGLAEGQKIRMAALDSYNGQVWSVAGPSTETEGTGGFELLGEHIPAPSLFTPAASSSLTFSIEAYDDVWLPGAGYPSSLHFTGATGQDAAANVRVNTDSGSTAVTSGVDRGLRYTMGVVQQRVPSDKKLASVPAARLPMPPVTTIPDVVAAKAEEYAGSATSVIQQLRNIERSLKSVGYLSHGLASDPVPSRAGSGADRMTELFTSEPMVGDEEQYTSAFALMARHLGYPVRVVMGFAPKVKQGQSTVTVTGKDVTAWDEVAFAGVGWVPFYPTPTKTDAPQEQTTKPKIEPQPQVRQPPMTNQRQDELLTPVKISDKNPRDKQHGFNVPAWVWWTAGGVGIPVLLVVLIVLGVAALKRRRRRRRFASGPPHARAAGSWDELVDRYAELGLEIPGVATRRQVALALGEQATAQSLAVPEAGLAPLALSIDDAVFSHEGPSEQAVDAVWHETDAVVAASSASAGWLRRRIAGFRYRRRRL
ncbi:transglutaminase-like domain-containing protein [Microbacterium sp. STN6]|uniref:transglutaminase-like domain-containing protein n=1 Tax=Microbacterium sp. STN6 TaxID=2995588 RepID=UPI002260E2BF|nr:transglutaminase-like domain-containing protein [Microbacterium sp. STN6]MCX7522084.1 transglutaminase-like domain-containing protein [Microbacterium sp. STN6]